MAVSTDLLCTRLSMGFGIGVIFRYSETCVTRFFHEGTEVQNFSLSMFP